MNEHIAARCPLYKTETLFIIEPFDLSQFLAHYSDSFIEQMPLWGNVNAGIIQKWPELSNCSGLLKSLPDGS